MNSNNWKKIPVKNTHKKIKEIKSKKYLFNFLLNLFVKKFINKKNIKAIIFIKINKFIYEKKIL